MKEGRRWGKRGSSSLARQGRGGVEGSLGRHRSERRGGRRGGSGTADVSGGTSAQKQHRLRRGHERPEASSARRGAPFWCRGFFAGAAAAGGCSNGVAGAGVIGDVVSAVRANTEGGVAAAFFHGRRPACFHARTGSAGRRLRRDRLERRLGGAPPRVPWPIERLLGRPRALACARRRCADAITPDRSPASSRGSDCRTSRGAGLLWPERQHRTWLSRLAAWRWQPGSTPCPRCAARRPARADMRAIAAVGADAPPAPRGASRARPC